MPRGTFQEDPSLWWAPASPRLCRRPQTWQGAVVQSPMRLLLLSSGSWCIHNFVCALQEWSLCFTHSSGRPIIKSHWPWRPDFLVIPSLFVRSPNWEAWLGPCEDSEPSQWCKDFFSFIVLQSVGLFILFLGFSRQEYWSSLPFPSPVDHILSELYQRSI